MIIIGNTDLHELPLFRTLKSVAICWWLLTECELLEPWWQESYRIDSLPKMAGEYEGAQRNTNFGWQWWCPLLSSSCCYSGVSLHFVMPFFPFVGTVDTTFCHSIVCNVLSISVWVKKNSELRVKVLDPKLSVNLFCRAGCLQEQSVRPCFTISACLICF